MNEGALVYFATGTVLFFFWIYGIVAFVRDLRGTYVPMARQYLRGRRRQRREREEEDRREERKQELL